MGHYFIVMTDFDLLIPGIHTSGHHSTISAQISRQQMLWVILQLPVDMCGKKSYISKPEVISGSNYATHGELAGSISQMVAVLCV